MRISATFQNVDVRVTDAQGNVICKYQGDNIYYEFDVDNLMGDLGNLACKAAEIGKAFKAAHSAPESLGPKPFVPGEL